MRLGSWKPLRPGVDKLTLGLGLDGEEVALLRYAPGAWVPEHKHPGRETLLMLEGVQADQGGSYGAGALKIMEVGTQHSLNSETGCLLLIHWAKPVRFVEDLEEIGN